MGLDEPFPSWALSQFSLASPCVREVPFAPFYRRRAELSLGCMLESLGIFKNPMARLHPRPRKELRLGTGISVFSKAAGQLQVQLGGEQLS